MNNSFTKFWNKIDMSLQVTSFTSHIGNISDCLRWKKQSTTSMSGNTDNAVFITALSKSDIIFIGAKVRIAYSSSAVSTALNMANSCWTCCLNDTSEYANGKATLSHIRLCWLSVYNQNEPSKTKMK